MSRFHVELHGGPAATLLELERAPRLLRVVIDGAGKVDALDQLEDQPVLDETVHVYARGRVLGRAHVSMYRRSASYFATAIEYLHVVGALEGRPDELIYTDRWRAYAREVDAALQSGSLFVYATDGGRTHA